MMLINNKIIKRLVTYNMFLTVINLILCVTVSQAWKYYDNFLLYKYFIQTCGVLTFFLQMYNKSALIDHPEKQHMFKTALK